jgi:hypothetical protein
MRERWHRVLVAIEAVLLAAPVTYVSASMTVLSIATLFEGNSEPYDRAQSLVYLLPVAPLACGWVLITRFVRRGIDGLQTTSSGVWLLAWLGVAMLLTAFFANATFDVHRLEGEPTMWLWILKYYRELVFGLPALAPLLHVWLVGRSRMPSNPSLERP